MCVCVCVCVCVCLRVWKYVACTMYLHCRRHHALLLPAVARFHVGGGTGP